jgi:hypothetical protein
MYVVKPPNDFRSVDADYQYAFFLAGSIDMGKADLWQPRVAEGFADLPVLIIDPRRDDWDSSWKQDPTPGTKFYQQVEWEQEALDFADTHIFYFADHSQSPITLMEFGQHYLKDHVYVRCTPNFWRYGNIKFICDRNGIPCFDHELTSEQDMIRKIREDLCW